MGFRNKDVYVISDGTICETKRNDAQNVEATFEDALKLVGFGLVQIFILLVSGLVLMAVINETMGASFIMPAAKCDLELTTTRKGVISSVSIIGILVSSQIWGYLSDTRGRRVVILYTMLISIACSFCSSFANSFELFLVGRFFTGFFISGSAATIYAYLGEFCSSKNRPTIIGWVCLSVALAYLYLTLCAWLILPISWSLKFYDGYFYKPWRLLVIVYMLPGLIGALILLKLPESSKYLLSQGRHEEALNILKWAFSKNTGRPMDEYPVHKLIPEMDTPIIQHNHDDCFGIIKSFFRQVSALFGKKYWFNYSICCFLEFGVFFVSAGMGLWFPHIQNELSSRNSTEYGTVCQILANTQNVTSMEKLTCDDTINPKIYTDSLILSVFYIVGYIAYACTIQPLGRGVVLVTSLFCSGIAGLTLQWIIHPVVIVIFFSLHLMFAGICVSITNGAVVDLIPTHLRGMAVSVALMFGRIGSIIGGSMVGMLLEYNCSATFYIYTFFIIGCAITALFLPCR